MTASQMNAGAKRPTEHPPNRGCPVHTWDIWGNTANALKPQFLVC